MLPERHTWEAVVRIDSSKARLYYRDRVEHYEDCKVALAVYLGTPAGVRIAYRGPGDAEPVYAWDYLDRK